MDGARREIEGVLCHEMVHVVQEDGEGTAPGWWIEGLADWVRLEGGLGAKHCGSRSSLQPFGVEKHQAEYVMFRGNREETGSRLKLEGRVVSRSILSPSYSAFSSLFTSPKPPSDIFLSNLFLPYLSLPLPLLATQRRSSSPISLNTSIPPSAPKSTLASNSPPGRTTGSKN